MVVPRYGRRLIIGGHCGGIRVILGCTGHGHGVVVLRGGLIGGLLHVRRGAGGGVCHGGLRRGGYLGGACRVDAVLVGGGQGVGIGYRLEIGRFLSCPPGVLGSRQSGLILCQGVLSVLANVVMADAALAYSADHRSAVAAAWADCWAFSAVVVAEAQVLAAAASLTAWVAVAAAWLF